MPCAPVRPVRQQGPAQEYRQHAQDADHRRPAVGVLLEGDQQKSHERPQSIARLEGRRETAAVVAAHPIRGREQPIEVLQRFGYRGGAGLRQSSAVFGDVIGELLHVAIELRETPERGLHMRRIFLAAVRIGPGESENGHSGGARLRQAAASNLEIQVIVLRRQQHVARRHQELVGGHDALAAKLHGASRSRPVAGVLTVPDGDHQAAVARNDGAGALQLAVAQLPGAPDVVGVRIRRKAELDHVARIAEPIESGPVLL